DKPNKSARLKESYKIVIRKGKGAARVLACNNLALLYLQEGKPDEAIHVFAIVGNPETSDAHAFYYNFGQALEQAEKPMEALGKYWLSIRKEPYYFRAAAGAAKLLAGNRDLPGRLDE